MSKKGTEEHLTEIAAGLPREALERIAVVACQTLETVDNWLGQASTRNAAADALWRLRRLLWDADMRANPWEDLKWRGSVFEYLKRAGFRLAPDGVRQELKTDKPWEWPTGPFLEDVLKELRDTVHTLKASSEAYAEQKCKGWRLRALAAEMALEDAVRGKP